MNRTPPKAKNVKQKLTQVQIKVFVLQAIEAAPIIIGVSHDCAGQNLDEQNNRDQWMRLPGDVVFAIGALLMAWDFIVKLGPLYPAMARWLGVPILVQEQPAE